MDQTAATSIPYIRRNTVIENIFFRESKYFFSGGFTCLNVDQDQYFREHVALNRSECYKLCLATLDQSNGQQWFNERYKRITASKAHYLLRARTPDQQQKYFCGQPIPFSNQATEYGIALESEARKSFAQLSGGVNVVETGLVVRHDQPWLAGSPDGLFVNKDNELCVLEIKCPFTCKDGPIKTRYINDWGHLLTTHCYYTQVQLLMYITGAEQCQFFVYSSQDHKNISVPINLSFLSNAVIELEKMYVNVCLPSIKK